MSTIFTDQGKEALLKAMTKYPESPFFREDGKAYCRFDSISIRPKKWFKPGVDVFFFWKGTELMVIESRGEPNFKENETLTINGIEGRMEVKIGD